MGIKGSVVDTQTVVTLTETSESVTFPEANLSVVGIVSNGVYTKIPISPARQAVLPQVIGAYPTAAQLTSVTGVLRRVNFQIDGTKLNYFTYQKGTSVTTCFYYGDALEESRPLTDFLGVTTAVTLSAGAGTGTLTFPAGNFHFNGISAAFGLAAQSTVIQLAWSTSSGKTFNAFVPAATLANFDGNRHDVIPIDFNVAQTLSVTLSLGTGADVVVIYAFYDGDGK